MSGKRAKEGWGRQGMKGQGIRSPSGRAQSDVRKCGNVGETCERSRAQSEALWWRCELVQRGRVDVQAREDRTSRSILLSRIAVMGPTLS